MQTRDHNRRTALLRPQRHVEREPLAIGREVRPMQVILRMPDDVHSLTRYDVDRAVADRLPPTVKNFLTVRRPVHRQTATIAELFSHAPVSRNQIENGLAAVRTRGIHDFGAIRRNQRVALIPGTGGQR